MAQAQPYNGPYSGFGWEVLSSQNVRRLRVPGGWLYVTTHWSDGLEIMSSPAFVPLHAEEPAP
jgi:hypothetical protein